MFFVAGAFGADITGRVLDAATGEPVAKALVRASAETVTGDDGRFSLNGTGSLQVSSVGYRPFRMDLTGGEGDLEIRLVPDTLRRTDSLRVSGQVFPPEVSLDLAGSELRNLASVLADDPLRAVQGLPGVTSNDDFQSQPSLRGASFDRLGVYLDGVLLHSPFHTVQGEVGAGSLTLLSSDMLEQLELHSGPVPAPFADRAAGAIDLRYRDGDRKRRYTRASASASNASASFEGPFAKGRGSWLASVRKSYLQYLIQSTAEDPSLAFGFWDAQGRLSYDLTARHRVSLSVLHGKSGLDRTGAENSLGFNATFQTDYSMTIANAGSRWTPSQRLLLHNNFAWMRERFENLNKQALPLAGGHYGEWIWNSSNTWQWGENGSLYFGAGARRLRDEGFLNRIQPAVRLESYGRTAMRQGGFVSQEYRFWHGRITLRTGGRVDSHSTVTPVAVSPSASVGLAPFVRSRVTLQWGHNVQYPELSQLANPRLPMRAIHWNAAWEQRFGERTRVRVDLWRRDDRDLLHRPLFDFRIVNGRVGGGNPLAPWLNSQRGSARGVQFLLQRRSANRLSGWISYAFTRARIRDGFLAIEYPADFEQKHTVNLFSTYRVRPTVNLSAKWSYGSGFPLRGFYRPAAGGAFFLSTARNQLRIPDYHRLDLRANKTFVRARWQTTLFAEVVNLYNHRNTRFDELRSLNGATGLVRLGFDRMFPVLPSAGVAIEF